MSLVNFNQKVQRIIQDEAAILNKADIDNFIIEALGYYSKSCPLLKYSDIIGNDGCEYILPKALDLKFSMLKSIEYPVGKRIAEYVDPGDYMVYKNNIGTMLRFLTIRPELGKHIKLKYTTVYKETEIELIPCEDIDAFCSLAASLCCGALARYYSQTVPTPQEVSVVDFPAKTAEYTERAKELLGAYNKHVKNSLRY